MIELFDKASNCETYDAPAPARSVRAQHRRHAQPACPLVFCHEQAIAPQATPAGTNNIARALPSHLVARRKNTAFAASLASAFEAQGGRVCVGRCNGEVSDKARHVATRLETQSPCVPIAIGAVGARVAVCVDSSTAKSLAERQGRGGLRHMVVRQFGLQAYGQSGQVSIKKGSGHRKAGRRADQAAHA